MELQKLCIGERFDHDIPDESVSIMIAAGSPLLTFNFSVTPGEIDAFSTGAATFALFFEQNVLFILFKIEGFLDWSDLAFTPHLAAGETIAPGNAFLPIDLVLTEPDSKIVKGLRMVTVSPSFRLKLAECFRNKPKNPLIPWCIFKRSANFMINIPRQPIY